MSFAWIFDPAAWAGLATLVVLEIVLGIDNLVFIAILADKLPPEQRPKARYVGLGLALGMRLGLLASVAWVVTLTDPLFTVLGSEISGRDLILIVGGVFLLFKGTMELHERLEGHSGPKKGKRAHAVFWQVLVQIVVLDAVFSLDSVITAVGMVDDLTVMMVAVVIAVALMMAAAKPLMTFVSKHPTVVVLCLGFLMMIGFSLVIEGIAFHIPKGYLYAAIGFSILIEAFNQFVRRKKEHRLEAGDLRDRTAEAVLRLIAGETTDTELGDAAVASTPQAEEKGLFAPEEKAMIAGVLGLAERPVSSIMTSRGEIDWLDLAMSEDALRAKILELGRSRYLLSRGGLDDFVGVALARDLMRDLLSDGGINLERSLRQPVIVPERASALRVMDQLRQSPLQLAVVVDEFGSVRGIATPTDLLEAIAGEFPSEGEPSLVAERSEDGSWLLDGWIDVRKASSLLEIDLVDEKERYATLAGFILWRLGRLPETGEVLSTDSLEFEIVSMRGRNIDQVRVRRATSPGTTEPE